MRDNDTEPQGARGDDRLTSPVLSAFFREGKLTRIPAKRSKRIVVLERLLGEFLEKDTYHEREVNAILRKFHDDVATLRREFIMNKYMTRESGYYRLTEKGRRAAA